MMGRFQAVLRGASGLAGLCLLGTAAAQNGYVMGWDATPELDEAGGTELDRLSISPSGALGGDIYDTASDNPLVPVSVTLRALDKITATYEDLEVPIGEEAAFGALTLLPRTCNTRPPEEFPETTVYLEVYSTERDVQGRRTRGAATADAQREPGAIRLPGQEKAEDAPQGDEVFRGWMFASSPALNALEHPVYDVWVIGCRMALPEA